MKPPAPTKPLSSRELEKDAAEAGVAADEATTRNGDTHLPASEDEAASQGERPRSTIERALTQLPPG